MKANKTADDERKDLILLARAAIETELAHYLDKLWKVFSWASAILVSITGGVIALRLGGNPLSLSIVDKIGLMFAVVVLSFSAWRHLGLILSFEINARDKLDECDRALGISKYLSISRGRPDRDPRSKRFSYTATIALLALAAIFTIIFGF